MNSKELLEFLNKRFQNDFWDESYAINGLQVEAPKEIDKIVFAVDASLELFEKSKDADLIIVHHGLFWKGANQVITKNMFKKAKTLLDNNIGLYAIHLPLDYDNELGNNAEIIKTLNLNYLKDFNQVGKIAQTKQEISFEEFNNLVKEKINPNTKSLKFNNKVSKVAIVSGSGAKSIYEAINENCDTLITGDQSHAIYHEAKENNINLIFSGHYATEVFGVKALMKELENKFKLKCEFINIPTNL